MGFFNKIFGREKKGDTQDNSNDAKWRVYNQRILEYASKRQWGLYRNNKLDMARLLIKEGRHKQAVSTLFEVCYLDLNGCNNVGDGISNNDMERLGIHEFDQKDAFLAPGIISMIESEINTLELDETSLKKLFVETNNQTKPKKDMPLSSEEAWGKLSRQLQKSKKLQQINPSNTTALFKEINQSIKAKDYASAVQLIQKIKSAFYSKKKEYPDIIEIKKHISALLESEREQIRRAAESLLLLIAKKDYERISDTMENYVKRLQNDEDAYSESNIIGEIASINLELVKPFIPKLIQNISQHPEWNTRRFSAFNIGAIGSKNPELIKDAIPVMIEYIKKPYEVTKRAPIVVKAKERTVSLDLSAEKMLGVDQTQWLKDAYIDSIGMIAKVDPKRIFKFKSLFEEITQKDKSEYSRKKAQNVLNSLK